MNKTALLLLIAITFLASCNNKYDIVIYGGSSAGVAAAITASRNNKKVIIIEPTDRLGGLTTGGLGQTDAGIRETIRGISRDFLSESI